MRKRPTSKSNSLATYYRKIQKAFPWSPDDLNVDEPDGGHNRSTVRQGLAALALAWTKHLSQLANEVAHGT